MPYENEHSCRLLKPVKGAPTRRVNGQRKHKGKPYDVIFQKQNDDWKEQAYRYPTKDWTESSARSHCTSHKGIRFEPAAKEGKEKVPEPDFSANDPQVNPAIFTSPDGVEFASENASDRKRLRLTLYDGSVVNHWYWGNLAFELSTMRMAKKRNPILFNHDVSQRIAYSDTAQFEPKFVMEGNILKSSANGQEIQEQMSEGFPFESSLRFDPERSTIEMIKEDESSEVNGHKLKGPGTIIRDALIMEGSVCVFGALKNTKSQIFKEMIMSKEKEEKMTVEDLTVDNFANILPEIHTQIVGQARAEGVKDEQDRFAALQNVCGDDHALIVECFAEGKTPAEASALRVAKLEQENKTLAEQINKQTSRPADPAKQEFLNASAPGTQESENFNEATATDEQLTAHFEKSPDLQGEFKMGGVTSYIHYVREKSAGRVRETGVK